MKSSRDPIISKAPMRLFWVVPRCMGDVQRAEMSEPLAGEPGAVAPGADPWTSPEMGEPADDSGMRRVNHSSSPNFWNGLANNT